MLLPGYRAQFELNVSEGNCAVSKSEICAGVFCAIPSYYSAAKQEVALEDKLEIAATNGSLSPPSFSHSACLTDLNMETTLANRSLFLKTCRQHPLYLKLRALHISPSRLILGII